ncbi:MAG: helix-turn-helix transcriptional regulator [Actinomycetota bacterium]
MAEAVEVRFRRLLTLVPYVVKRPGISVKELCREFAINRTQLVADLNLLFVCGLPGYGPGDLIEAFIDGNRVSIRLADYFSRPLRLTPAEGLLLYTGAQALAAAGVGDEALSRAVARLERALGPDVLSRVTVELEGTGELTTIREALLSRRRLHLVYYTHSRDATTERDVDPWTLFLSSGRWYLVGWCHRVDGERIFRLDRIRSAALLDDPADIPDGVDLAKYESLYVRHDEDAEVVMELSPRVAGWMAESYPLVAEEPLDGGWVRVRLAAGGTAWLEKLLLRLGPEARVVSPPELTERMKALACRLAQRYRATPDAGRGINPDHQGMTQQS